MLRAPLVPETIFVLSFMEDKESVDSSIVVTLVESRSIFVAKSAGRA